MTKEATSDKFLRALAAESNCDRVQYMKPGDQPLYIQNAKDSVHLAFSDAATARNFVYILRELPKVMQDHMALAEAVKALLGLVAEQQIQLHALEEQVQHALLAKIAVQAQQDAYGNIQATIARGSDIAKQEITVSVTAIADSAQSSSSENRSHDESGYQASAQTTRTVVDVRKRSGEIAGDVSGLLKAVGGLKLTGKFGATTEVGSTRACAAIKKAVARVSALESVAGSQTTHTEFRGTMTLKVEGVTGDPVIRAQAEVIRKFGRSSSTIKSDTDARSKRSSSHPARPSKRRS